MRPTEPALARPPRSARVALPGPPVPDVEPAQLGVVIVHQLVPRERIGFDGERGVELGLELVDQLHGGLRLWAPVAPAETGA